MVLEKDLDYVDTFGILPLIEKLSTKPGTDVWDPPNLLLSGPSGVGKTLLTAFLAEDLGIPYLEVNCSPEIKERHLRGGLVPKGTSSVEFIFGTASNAIMAANELGRAMLVLDELPTLSPLMQKSLNPLTDFRRKVELPEISTHLEVMRHCKLWVVATRNTLSVEGSYELNQDLKSRFIEIEIPYPPPEAEKSIIRKLLGMVDENALAALVAVANESRQGESSYALSTRDLVELMTAHPRVGWHDTLFLTAQKFSAEDRTFISTRIRDITTITPNHSLVSRLIPT
jgi:nitric oxide reductase NorQ protein